MAMFSVSFTCYNDRNKTPCNIIARMSDDPKYMEDTIRRIKKDHPDKFITMKMHSGKEYDPFATKESQDFARKAIDAGVELVIGHHPHTIGEVEIYNGAFIFYSLGNSFFDQDWTKLTMKGLSVSVQTKYDDEIKKHVLNEIKLVHIMGGFESQNFVPNFEWIKIDPLEYLDNEDERTAGMELSKALFDAVDLEVDRYLPLHHEYEDCMKKRETDDFASRCNRFSQVKFLATNH